MRRAETNRWLLRAAWAIAVALWAVAVWMWFDIREATVPPALTPPPPLPLAADDAAKPAPVFVPERARGAPSDEVRGAASAPLRARAVDAALCGIDGSADSARDTESLLARQRQSAAQRAADALNARGDAASQAVAALLELARRREPPAPEAAAASSAQPVARLYELARTSGDPWLIQLGLIACDVQGAARACPISPRRLTSADADNAAAWLELAARESGAADEAMFRASQATRFETRAAALAERVDEALGAATPLLQRWLAIEQASALPGAAVAAAGTAALRYCSDAGVRDANRGQVCDRLARLLLRTGRDASELQLGQTIAARLGATDEARPGERDELRAGAEALRLARGDAPYGCAALEHQLAHWREARRNGDLAAARAAIQRSGFGVAELLASAERASAPRATAAAPAASTPSAR